MGLADEQFVDGELISETLRCPICHDVFSDPVFCAGKPCQCVFCRSCIEEALQRSQFCPLDRMPLDGADIVPHQFVRSSIDELQAFCSNRNAGCFWVGRYDARKGHEESCVAGMFQTATNASKALRSQLDAQHVQIKDLLGVVAEREAKIQLLLSERTRELVAKRDAEISRLRLVIAAHESELDQLCANAASASSPAATSLGSTSPHSWEGFPVQRMRLRRLSGPATADMSDGVENANAPDVRDWGNRRIGRDTAVRSQGWVSPAAVPAMESLDHQGGWDPRSHDSTQDAETVRRQVDWDWRRNQALPNSETLRFQGDWGWRCRTYATQAQSDRRQGDWDWRARGDAPGAEGSQSQGEWNWGSRTAAPNVDSAHPHDDWDWSRGNDEQWWPASGDRHGMASNVGVRSDRGNTACLLAFPRQSPSSWRSTDRRRVF
mmetsp:Transcript_123490/g.349037  ORF Transcript_123490/g.349037 Transcript_123490/m.349037 type:complete len:435 (-) Transcript_123490:98-1402(-)